MDIDYKKMGLRIRLARESKNLTQESLAQSIGLTNNYICNIEKSYSIPSIKTLIKICNFLEVSPDYILLDSIFTSKEYLKDEIAVNLRKCSEKQTALVSKFISLLLE